MLSPRAVTPLVQDPLSVAAHGSNPDVTPCGPLTEAERDELIRLGAVGDITGWAFDAQGRQIEGGSNARLTAIPHRLPLERLTVGVAGGASKARAIAGALCGGLVSGLITDEAAARAILELDPHRR